MKYLIPLTLPLHTTITPIQNSTTDWGLKVIVTKFEDLSLILFPKTGFLGVAMKPVELELAL